MSELLSAKFISPALDQASIYSDLNSLDNIRRQGLTDEQGAIKKAAKEFEAFFMNMMLKSMRQASAVIGEDSPFSSQQEKMFIGMLDEQMSVNLSQDGHFGIAEMMIAQLSQKNSDTEKPSKFPERAAVSRIDNAHVVKGTKPLTYSSRDALVSVEKAIEKNTVAINSIKNKQLDVKKYEQAVNAKVMVEQPKLQPEKKAVFKNIKEFVSTLLPYAKKAAQKLSVDPKLLIAQAALETGWGKFIMHDGEGKPGHNLFGIKASNRWQGEKINIDTLEVDNQAFKKVNASFRKYNSFAESFDDYVDFVTQNPRYQKAVEAAENANEYINELQNSGYATDPDYAEKILRIFDDKKFFEFNEATE
ncbi:flagellar assembly peptidoglycan hydrolase FlgJ [Aliikangiella sp. IMCC44359]|uniref:flagellar assembly peptidoglycan hydrolase FlgJ n=1 Tax=Aliikangiella sp. IMCC44359 TaxID=3459125 RepID=UPI00403A89F2